MVPCSGHFIYYVPPRYDGERTRARAIVTWRDGPTIIPATPSEAPTQIPTGTQVPTPGATQTPSIVPTGTPTLSSEAPTPNPTLVPTTAPTKPCVITEAGTDKVEKGAECKFPGKYGIVCRKQSNQLVKMVMLTHYKVSGPVEAVTPQADHLCLVLRPVGLSRKWQNFPGALTTSARLLQCRGMPANARSVRSNRLP